MHSRFIFLVARLLPNVFGVLTTALLTRLLPPAEYGTYALGLSAIAFLTIGLFDWLGLSLLRLVATTKQPDLFLGTMLTCFGVLSVLCAGIILGVVVWTDVEAYAALAAACWVATVSTAWVELKLRLQMAELRDSTYFRTSVIRGLISTISVCMAAYLWRNGSIIVLTLGVSVFLAGLIAREPRLSFFRSRLDWAACRTLLHFGIPLALSSGLAVIQASIDRFLLQDLVGASAVGMFTAAMLMAQTPLLALAGGIGPSAYAMAVDALERGSVEAARVKLSQNFVILLGILLPGAVGIIAVSRNLAHLLLGSPYWEIAILLTPIMAVEAVLMGIRSFYVDVAFQLARRTSRLAWTTLATIAVNIALDLWLIPLHHELGAAISSFMATSIGILIAAIASINVFRLPIPIADTLKVLASTALMFLVLYGTRDFSGNLALFAQITAGFCTYVCGLAALNVLGVRGWLNQRLLRRAARDVAP